MTTPARSCNAAGHTCTRERTKTRERTRPTRRIRPTAASKPPPSRPTSPDRAPPSRASPPAPGLGRGRVGEIRLDQRGLGAVSRLRVALLGRRQPEILHHEHPDGAGATARTAACLHPPHDLPDRHLLALAYFIQRIPQLGLQPHTRAAAPCYHIPIDQPTCH